jgi:hypothetical protein
MSQITIKIYQRDDGAGNGERRLIRTVHLENSSVKQLTGKRAGQILAREFPEFSKLGLGMTRTKEGWSAMRTVRPTKGCSYHYIWEHAEISEDQNKS